MWVVSSWNGIDSGNLCRILNILPGFVRNGTIDLANDADDPSTRHSSCSVQSGLLYEFEDTSNAILWSTRSSLSNKVQLCRVVSQRSSTSFFLSSGSLLILVALMASFNPLVWAPSSEACVTCASYDTVSTCFTAGREGLCVGFRFECVSKVQRGGTWNMMILELVFVTGF